MFQIWFNTFFVEIDGTKEKRHENGSAKYIGDVTGSQVNKTVTLSMTFGKGDLDKANKDKSHKLFSPNFKVITV